MSAPSEMRCMSIPVISMSEKTMASVNGMASAMTKPGRMPRLMKLTARMIATACQSEVMNSEIALLDRDGLIGDEDGLNSHRQIGYYFRHVLRYVVAEAENVAAFAHGDGEAYRRLAVYPELRLWRVDIAPVDAGDVAQAKHSPAYCEVDVGYVLF